MSRHTSELNFIKSKQSHPQIYTNTHQHEVVSQNNVSPDHLFPEIIDRSFHATFSRLTGGLSPIVVINAYIDWMSHLTFSPGKQSHLVYKAMRKWIKFLDYAARCTYSNSKQTPCILPLPQDKRFLGEAWQTFPFNLYYQGFLLNQQWWHNAMTDVRGVTKQHEDIIDFTTRQILDIFSPSNFMLTNPEILEQTHHEMGRNLLEGYKNFVDDWQHHFTKNSPDGAHAYKVGENLAITPGKVVFRNQLMELIQYSPATETVHKEPILIVPAWIMKYYILDLSSKNSLVKYLTEQGFTVFMISWKNPTFEDRECGMKDYREHGVLTAIDVISSVVPNEKIHGVGYCLGGTLLAITAAALAHEKTDIFQSLSLLAAQVDFKEAGELRLFINESQLAFLEDMMWEQGYLDTSQMAGAFQILRSNDLIWSKILNDYFMGKRRSVNDLMAWNADATRMPYRMHTQYLRWLFLNNDLAEGRYKVDEHKIALTDIRTPIFAVGTKKDHVAPWQSVYKIHLLSDTETTFLLTNGGHNAGIVSEPGHRGRTYQITTRHQEDQYIAPELWEAQTPSKQGSWWQEWVDWLSRHSSEEKVTPPVIQDEGERSICEAPGTYVFQK